MFYINHYFCDIVPPCFYHLFRPDHPNWDKNFFDAYNPTKNIDYVFYDDRDALTVVYDDGTEREAIYCHLQKRPMQIDFSTASGGFNIREHSFDKTQ
jgi:hypothetical protein